MSVQLQDRICACGCGKHFRCLPSSQTRYSSLHCMEVAGVLPPVEKFGRGGAKISRPVATGATTEDDADAEADDGSDSDAPLMMEEGEEFVAGEDRESKNPPEIDPAA